MVWPFTRKKKTGDTRFDELPPFWQGYMTEMSELNEGTIAHLTVENEALRARLETVEAETRERCAKVANATLKQFEDIDGPRQTVVAAIRNLEPRHD